MKNVLLSWLCLLIPLCLVALSFSGNEFGSLIILWFKLV